MKNNQSRASSSPLLVLLASLCLSRLLALPATAWCLTTQRPASTTTQCSLLAWSPRFAACALQTSTAHSWNLPQGHPVFTLTASRTKTPFSNPPIPGLVSTQPWHLPACLPLTKSYPATPWNSLCLHDKHRDKRFIYLLFQQVHKMYKRNILYHLFEKVKYA